MNVFTIAADCHRSRGLVAYLNQSGFLTLTRGGLGGVGIQVTTDAPPYIIYTAKKILGLSTVAG